MKTKEAHKIVVLCTKNEKGEKRYVARLYRKNKYISGFWHEGQTAKALALASAFGYYLGLRERGYKDVKLIIGEEYDAKDYDFIKAVHEHKHGNVTCEIVNYIAETYGIRENEEHTGAGLG